MKLTPREPTLEMMRAIPTWIRTSIVDGGWKSMWRSMHDAAPSGWQPIETAPRDVELLLFCPDRGPTNEARFEIREFYNTKGGSQHAWATHWMPLPAPPSEQPQAAPSVPSVEQELLEALELCLNAVVLAGWEGDFCAIKARAAIARAKGE